MDEPLVVEVFHQGRVWSAHLPHGRPLRIGRGTGCDIRLLNDASVSRQHVELVLHDAGVTIVDLGSQNGTRLAPSASVEETTVQTRGDRLTPHTPHPLQVGDRVQVGTALLWIRRAAAPETHVPLDPVVADPAMQALHELVGRLAPSDLSVLILGESGVGKEVFARQLHVRSRRHAAPFMSLNCGAFAETLLESELFGHERGAFTGASAARPGLLEAAQGGTVFFDEVGELPPQVQVKLLRVIEDRQVLRLGAREPRAIDVRFVAATNRDLAAEVATGRFRQDLYFRLNGMTLRIPALRDRPSEIEPLAQQLLARACQRSHRPSLTLAPDAVERLRNHRWPGNVRELRNAMDRAAALVTADRVRADDLLIDPDPGTEPADRSPTLLPPADASEAAEYARIVAALDACAGNQTRAAAMLGMTRRVLTRRLVRYGIPRPRS